MAFFLLPFRDDQISIQRKDKSKMAKYFMSGTRLEGLERLMMDPSRSEHSPAPDVYREKGRCPKPGQPDNNQLRKDEVSR